MGIPEPNGTAALPSLMATGAANLKKGGHVVIEGELRSREYVREITVGNQNNEHHSAGLGDPR